LSFLLRLWDAATVPGFAWLADVPPLPTTALAYIGLRDVDDGEKRLIRSLGVKAFTMREVDKHGIGKVMEMALDHVLAGPHARNALHLS
ncbi:arginase family protein, partial [Escherichia coli]|nr:arginase family protein [Escherichia coli]